MIYLLKGSSKNGNPSKEKWCLFDSHHQAAFFFQEEDYDKAIEKIAEDYCSEWQAGEVSVSPEKEIAEILKKEYNFKVLMTESMQIDFLAQRMRNLLY